VEGPAVEHSLAPLAAIGIETAEHGTVVVASEAERATARRLLADLGLGPRFWALHPGAGKRQNMWPAERFAAVADRAAAAGHDVLVLHGPADADAVTRMRGALEPGSAARVRIAPRLTVGGVVALLAQADRLLCNDTGIMHVAGALRVPTVALFGPTDPAVWKPPAVEVVAVTAAAGPDRSGGRSGTEMTAITVAEVWRALASLPSGGGAA
jgi:ADP-heptose:LPS heptosyltransferase